MGAIRDFIEFIKDAFAVTGAVLTSKWIWIIIGFGLYFIIQPLLMLAISPLTILILPAALIIYLILSEDKRTSTQYSLKKNRIDTTQWNVSKSVDEYIKTITKTQILDENREKDRE
jgi:hypothetical protein